MKRRPSFATVIALLALFIALGGPAEAQRLLGKGDVNSRVVKDRSLKTRDISKRTVRTLRTTPNGSVTEAKIRNGAVTPGKLAAGAVGSGAIADGSIMGADIASGALTASQISRFWGRFRIQVPAVGAGMCWSGEPAGLAPELGNVDISQDLVLATPDHRWPEDRLAFTVRNSANPTRFVLAGCNRTTSAVPAFEVGFRYVVIDLP